VTAEGRGGLGDTLFALFHVALLAAMAVSGILSLIKGNTGRFMIIFGGLAIYYFLVLDKPVRAEIERRRSLRAEAPPRSKKP
jgi:hypothetical protein